MQELKTIHIETLDGVATLWLNRPEKHNALNHELMGEVISFFKQIENDETIRIVILRGKGKSFCAGADLQWMKDSDFLSEEENLKESELLTEFFSAIYNSSKVTIAIVHGNVYGGGNGLAAVCDIAYGTSDARFSLSETRLGLIAATITPYMLKRLQSSIYKELIFTARVFNGNEAETIGLLNKSFSLFDAIEPYLKNTVESIKNAGPNSLVGSKKLIHRITDGSNPDEILNKIPKLLADVRVTPEAKEGFAAFLEKRKPSWIKS